MSCRDKRESLHRWVDGRMGVEERLALEGHLDACTSCRTQAEDLRKAGDALRDLEVPPVPMLLVDSILAELEKRPRPEPSLGRLLLGWSLAARAGAVAAALVVVAAGVGAGAGLAGSSNGADEVSGSLLKAESVTADGSTAQAASASPDGAILSSDSLIPEGVFEAAPEETQLAMLLEDEWTEGNP